MLADPGALPPHFWAPSHNEPDNYPWHLWLDGRIWALKQGIDYTIRPTSMRTRCHKMAKEFQCAVRTRMYRGMLYIQAIDPDTGQPLPEPAGGYSPTPA